VDGGMGDDGRRLLYEQAYRELYTPICGYVMRRVFGAEDAADIVAETFLVLWRRWEAAPQHALRPWMFGVARNAIANHRRGDQRRGALAARLRDEFRETDWPAPPEPDSAVGLAFARLTDADRELLSLVAWEGLTHEELAVALGVGRPVVRVRLHRARRRFESAFAAITDEARKRSGATGHVPLRQAPACSGVAKGES